MLLWHFWMVLYGVKDQVLAIKLFKYKQRYVVMDKVVTMTELKTFC